MTSRDFPVDSYRLHRDIEENAKFGAVPTEDGMARTVLPGTKPNERARTYLVNRMRDAGLDVTVDAVGNITGTWLPKGCDPEAAPVAAGSHLDSVPEGGIFDGVLGVYAALEAVRAMQDAGATADRPVEVVSFTGEEGTRFADGVLGSSVAAGELDTEDALALSDQSETLREALDGIGFHGEGRLDASDWHAWLELHIEQSSRLEQLDVPAGVVTSIAGTTRLHVSIEGTAAHSGTAAMDDRTDALAAASEFVLELEAATQDAAEENGGTTVATVGELSVEPGAVNVVPDRVDLSVDIRDVDGAVIDHLVERATATLDGLEADRGVTTAMDRPYDIPPTDMSPGCRGALKEAGSAVGVEMADLHSGAGHDTMEIATVTDVGLLFAPSQGGHSHSSSERTSWRHCTETTSILTEALGNLAGATIPVTNT